MNRLIAVLGLCTLCTLGGTAMSEEMQVPDGSSMYVHARIVALQQNLAETEQYLQLADAAESIIADLTLALYALPDAQFIEQLEYMKDQATGERQHELLAELNTFASYQEFVKITKEIAAHEAELHRLSDIIEAHYSTIDQLKTELIDGQDP